MRDGSNGYKKLLDRVPRLAKDVVQGPVIVTPPDNVETPFSLLAFSLFHNGSGSGGMRDGWLFRLLLQYAVSIAAMLLQQPACEYVG